MFKRISIVIFLVFFNSCSFLTQKNYVYYYLEPKISDSNLKNNILIQLDDVEVSKPFDRRDIYYSLKPLSLQFYVYHKWAVPIREILYSIMINNFNENNSIVFKGNLIKKQKRSYHMKVRVIKLLHQFKGNKSFALVEIKFLLYKDNRLINSKIYNIKKLCPSNTPYGAVLGFNEDFSIIFRDLSHFILTSLKSSP